MRFQHRQRAHFISVHQPAVADDVGGENSRKPALDGLALHVASLDDLMELSIASGLTAMVPEGVSVIRKPILSRPEIHVEPGRDTWRVSRRCPLYPQKRTFVSAIVMSAMCQKQTFRPLLDMVDGMPGKGF